MCRVWLGLVCYQTSLIGARVAQCGFDLYVRDDGLWSEGPDGFYDSGISPYNHYLKSQGYDGENPWAEHTTLTRGLTRRGR